MPTAVLPVRLLGFPRGEPSSLLLDVTAIELVYSVVTTGHGLTPFGGTYPYSMAELSWKIPLIQAVLARSSNRWIRDDHTDLLDPSEKGAVAYLLANAQTGLIARRQFGATHVAHLSKIDPKRYTRVSAGRTLPDFAAVDVRSKRAFVIEAKGSLHRVSNERLEKAFEQLDTRVSFPGYRSHLRYANLSEHNGRGQWAARIVRRSGSTSRVRLTVASLLRLYYAPIRDAIARQGGQLRDGFVSADISGVEIGLDGELFQITGSAEPRNVLTQSPAQRLRTNSGDVELEFLAAQVARVAVEPRPEEYIGRDGVRVRWAEN